MEQFSLENKIAVVTGALGLLGKQHCYALSEAGANVVVCDLDEQKCIEFAKKLNPRGAGMGADITDPDSVRKLRKKILKEFKQIDILVNNAAINDKFESPLAAKEYTRFENYPIELWSKSLEVNLTGTFLCSQILGTEMAVRNSGSIINIASTYGIVAPDQALYKNKDGEQVFYKTASYPVTKGGVIAFTKFLAAYWGESGVRVNSLSPGGVENMQSDYFVENYSSKTPLKRMAKADDYKGAIVFLASDASAYMTGANLVVDGGFTIC
jgi:NAD(P)-dependent dehydrogenase (short-subunit alcohol dehydrogenase family)